MLIGISFLTLCIMYHIWPLGPECQLPMVVHDVSHNIFIPCDILYVLATLGSYIHSLQCHLLVYVHLKCPLTGKNRKDHEILKPYSIIGYKAAKLGVDKLDQMICYHSILRKSIKWYRKLAFELILRTSIVNAWVHI